MQSIQELVLQLDPEAFTVFQKRNIDINQRYYLRPVDIIWDTELGFSTDPANEDYKPLERVKFQTLRGYSGGRNYSDAEAATPSQYAKTGNYYYLGWKPTANIADGLQVVYTPWLAMDEDDDVPGMSLGFHRMIKVDCAIKLLQETPEDTSKLEQERAEFVDKLKRYYRSSSTTPDLIELDLRKDVSIV